MKRLLTLGQAVTALCILLSFSAAAQAKPIRSKPAPFRFGTVTADSCTYADQYAAYLLTVDGDILILPACPSGVSMVHSLTVTKSITIQGDGRTSTILKDDVPRSENGGAMYLFSQNTPWRLTGVKLTSGTIGTQSNSTILIRGKSTAFRIDHNELNTFNIRVTFIEDSAGTRATGLLDHNIGNYGGQWIVASGNDDSGFGDESWNEDTNFGSSAAVYVEDNIVHGSLSGFTDVYCGGRIVVRFNTITHDHIASHGTESSGRCRGVRKMEVYANDVTMLDDWGNSLAFSQLVFLRSGTALVFKNTTNGVLYALAGKNYRDNNSYCPWKGSTGGIDCGGGFTVGGAADGTSLYDVNDGVLYYSGTHTGSNGATTLTDSMASFGALGYSFALYPGIGISGTDYSIYNATQKWGSAITGSSSTTITYKQPDQGAYTWQTGDSYEVRRAYPVLDQVGYGKNASPISGGDGGHPPTPAAWPDEAVEVAYVWGNVGTNSGGGGPNNLQPAKGEDIHVHVGRDIITNATTPGVTEGLLADRPTGCTPPAAYWATDQGSWNDGSNPNYTGQGVLYKCTATDTWTLYYTPYTYPHPLAASAPTLSSVTPSSGTQGASVPVTLTGTGFQGGNASVTVSGSGVTVSGCSVVSSVSITCTFIIDANATLNARDVAVHTDQGDSGNQPFTVFAVTPGTAPAAVRGVFR